MIFVYYVESDFKGLNIRVQIWRQGDYDDDDIISLFIINIY